GRETDGAAARPQIAAVDVVFGDRVVVVAVALGPRASQAHAQFIAHHGNIEHAFETPAVIISDVHRSHRFIMIAWLGGDEIYYARRRVAAIERSLRPAQNLHLLNVEEFLLEE